jgi:hypothetical protein
MEIFEGLDFASEEDRTKFDTVVTKFKELGLGETKTFTVDINISVIFARTGETGNQGKGREILYYVCQYPHLCV